MGYRGLYEIHAISDLPACIPLASTLRLTSVVNRAVLRAQMRRKPEEVLRDDSPWYAQAVEQIHRKSNAIAERLRPDD